MNEDGNARMGRLLEAARAGDRESLDTIVEELTPLLWHVARAQGLDRESSSDVVQQTWLTLVRSMDRIRAPGALVGWLVRVAKREAWRVAQASRSEDLVDTAERLDRPDRSPTPEELALAQDSRHELWSAVKRLPERCHQLLRVVAFVPRPNYHELSAVLGLPRGSIGPMRGRCLARLRTLLSGGVRDDR